MDDEDDEDYEEGDSMEYDLAPGEEDDYEDISDSEEDELDKIENPRVTEVDSDEEEAR
jgi:FK506-binding nuclear protein